jgi:hypothetical protein
MRLLSVRSDHGRGGSHRAQPAALLRAQSVAAAEPAVSGTKKRPSAMRARRHRDNENENARPQNRRWPYWGERAYWRGAYRNWVY